jgi:endonuclease-3
MTPALPVLKIWEAQNPSPSCELYYETPLQLLISVILSAQATDKSVNQAMTPLYKAGLTFESLLEMGPQGFLEKVKTIGLAPTKTKHIFQTLALLKFGQVPNSLEELTRLPGVGRKTANVILGEIYKEPTLAVDTHVYRVGLRLGWHRAKNPLKAEAELLQVLPRDSLPRAHHWMVLHGRYVCKAQKPQCQTCAIRAHCPSARSLCSLKTPSANSSESPTP